MRALSLLILLIYTFIAYSRNFPVACTGKNLLAMQETWVQSVGREGPLEKGMATLSSILALRSPWTEEPGGLQSSGLQRVGYDWATKHNIFKTMQRQFPSSLFDSSKIVRT